MEETELQNELASIRSIMERSSKFISLSGLSGILAGIYALAGAWVGYVIIHNAASDLRDVYANPGAIDDGDVNRLLYKASDVYLIRELFVVALVVLMASILTALVLSNRQAKRKGQPLWGSASRSLLFHMAVPLVTGGILILILVLHHHYGIVSAASLIFYGLALVSAGNFTFADIKYLGLCEIILGLTAACLPGHGLLFWAIGFGMLHIIYGARIYLKYDR